MAISGIWVPIVTPFRDGQVDYSSFDRLADHLIGQGANGLIVLGTTGESLALDASESHRLVEHTIERARGQVPVYVGISGAATHKVEEAIQTFDMYPIGGYLVACPYYNKPAQDGLLAHFQRVAGVTRKDILVYNIPSRTAVNMSNDVLLTLAQLPNVVGVKDCCGNLEQTIELLERRPQGFSVLTGEDALLFTMLAYGGDGGILASAHLATNRFVELADAFAAGDLPQARKLWAPLRSAIGLLFREPNPMPVKYYLWKQGLISSPECRLPLTEISSDLKAKLDQTLADLEPSLSAAQRS